MVPQSPVASGPSRPSRARWLLAALLLGSSLTACKQESQGGTPPSPALTPVVIAQDAGSPAAVTPAPIAKETLTPVIREVAASGIIPDSVAIELSRPVLARDRSLADSALRVEPGVQGQLTVTSDSTLTFTAQHPGFLPGTEYTVTLASLATTSGVLQPPSEGAWSYRFVTPDFRFVRLEPRQLDISKGHVEVDVVFSGPVDVNAVKARASFLLSGLAAASVKWKSKPSERNVVTARFQHPGLKAGSQVRFALKPGLPLATGAKATAPAAEQSFEVRGGKRLDITGISRGASNSGSYLEVSCRDVDGNAPPSPREGGEYDPYYYDSNNRGCLLDDAVAADSIRLTPKVKFSVAQSRRGFRIFGDFKRGTYTVRIAAGALSVGGGALLSDYEQAVSVPARTPQLSFSSAGRYLPRSAWRNLPLQHLNLDSVELVVRHVPAENLVFWMSNDYQESADERTSNVVVRKTLPLQSPPDTLVTTYVDVGSLVPPSTRGLVEVSVRGGRWAAASRILLTDLSLVAKRGGPSPDGKDAGEVHVWALGIESADPVSGVEVSLVKKSGQGVGRCVTKGSEGCVIKVPLPGADDSAPFALIARQGEEMTYLKYSELKTELPNADVQGEPYRSEKAYRASIWSDRGVYRPGDTAHLAAVLRGQDDQAPAAGMPVELVVVDPREREMKKVTLQTNAAGLVSLDVRFEAFQDTGHYRVQLKVANRDVASYAFNVEEFVPERMKVTAKVAQQAGYAQGVEIPVAVEAAYLFGGSAEGSPVELSCRLVPSTFKPKENAQYTYGLWRQGGKEPSPVTLGQVKGTLDAKGQALLNCPSQAATGALRGAGRLSALAAVFESGSGRSTVNEASVPVHPERYYLGLQSGASKAGMGKPFTVTGVVVDWEGRLMTASAPRTVEVEAIALEEEYGSYYDEDEGYDRYQRYLRPAQESRTTVPVKDGRFTVTLTPGRYAAGYLVRAKSGNAQTDLELEGDGYYYWWGDESRVDQTPRPLKPTSLDLALPAQGRVGQAIAVKLKAPYKGRVLFTAETDRVLASEWKAVQPGEVSWSFTPSSFAPNVYVSAFLVKDPHLESAEAFMPDRAFGVGSVTLEPADFTQTVTMKTPKEVRSNETFDVDLELGPLEGPTFATVAVVDEGILSLTRFQSPDPIKQLFTKRALGVETFETIGWTLLVPPGGNSRSTGGDAEGGAAGRVQPVKPVALWSGVVAVPANGRLRVPFTLPQYRGAVRVMAVTAGPRRVGRASAQVLVRDPLVLQTTLPRFLSQNDEIQVPVFVTNLSGKAQDVRVTLGAELLPVPGLSLPANAGSPLQLLGKSEGKARLEDGKSTTFVFQARATQAVGAARLSVTVEGGGYTSRESLDVPLSPSGPKERRVQRIELTDGVTDVSKFLQGWVPTTERTTLWVTSNPYGESFQHLSYLVRYPYGCIEQTTSSTRPLLFVSELIDDVDPTLTRGSSVGAMAQAGISRLLSMQTASGGFAYWPGQTEPVAWGTAYATHMLLDAQKLKYPVPQDRVNDALTWMTNHLASIEASGRGATVSAAGDEEAYIHYVLALAGKGRKARVQKLVDALAQSAKAHSLTGEEREMDYMLKAALWLSGDRRYEKELREPDVSPLTEERRNSWAFYSDRRRRGFMLSTFQDLFGGDAGGEPLAQMVASALQSHPSGWYTTQELVWGITGLGKRLKDSAGRFTPAVLSADGKVVEATQDKNARTSDRTWSLARASERQGLSLDLKPHGEGKVYLVLSSEGVRTDGVARSGGEGLKLTRTYRKQDGTALDLKAAPVALADLVYVELTLENLTAERVQNIAMVDRLPAGWEIENARLGRGGSVDWASADTLWAADYVNLRDDRVEVFGALQGRETKSFVYAVRAVTAGAFALPSAEAEAMYDPRLWAREAGGTVQVSGPWKDSLL
ncbi:MG2 domain-containing protein [Myxococcus stipitatus]|uniref:alpha-2-macroglobulin family protein n=1 Tax=Myxococcus stipitatus TaxID=83455 RepID=UPI001F16149F|nr:MG2 domain-containing protein [Myxococcus stipitatus]MCE9666610.1 MG2 domain-containing protein [Myxococcus stipitatus]